MSNFEIQANYTRCMSTLRPSERLLKILGVTFQNNCKYSSHVQSKITKANRCLHINQCEVDLFFKSVILPKLTYGLSVYGASTSDLFTVQNFLNRCFKRKYVSYNINVFDFLEDNDRAMYNKIKSDPGHPLFSSLPRFKDTSFNEVAYIPKLIQNVLKIAL